VEEQDFNTGALAAHLSMRVEVHADDGAVLASGRDLGALQRDLGIAPEALPRIEHSAWSRTGLTRWEVADLPDIVPLRRGMVELGLYPALVDELGRVDLALLPPGPPAVAHHREGVRRLLLKSLPQQVALIREQTLASRALVLSYHGVGASSELVDDLLCASADQCFVLEPPIRSAAQFERCLAAGRAELVPAAEQLRALLDDVLALYREIRGHLEAPGGRVPERALDDIAEQLGALVRPYFLTRTPVEWRPHLPRYLTAIRARWRKLEQLHPKDAELMARVHEATRRLAQWSEGASAAWPWPAPIVRYRWMLEEFRVSLFAQALGTAVPVSQRRLEEAWQQARRSV
jgi:ATP-dependent helicase HrpA